MVEKNEHNTYLPITSYGIIGNCHSALLISPEGSVDWGCLPDFDSPATFCRLLDARYGGYFQIAPTEGTIPGFQRYLRDSNVLQTRFASTFGEIVLTDFMPVETLSTRSSEEMKHKDEIAEVYSSHGLLVRIVECTRGEMAVTMRLKATPGYASLPGKITLAPDYKGAIVSWGGQHMVLGIRGASLYPSFSLDLSQDDEWHQTVVAQVTLQKDEQLIFALGIARSEDAASQLVEDVFPRQDFDTTLASTLHCWHQWVAQCKYRGPYEQWVRRSALTIKMMTYSPTGAMVASPTTSLPEELGGERNWDYRFTWLRDSAFTLTALHTLGFANEALAFAHWLCHLSCPDTEALQIMYGLHGERELAEQELTYLSGYCNSTPVRIGNGAAKQRQIDVFGEVLDCIYLYCQTKRMSNCIRIVEEDLWNLVQRLVEYVCAHWREPDSGIWEVRNGTQHFVYSKVMCWVALDRGVYIAQLLNRAADLPRWMLVRDQIRADILKYGYNTAIRSFTQSYDNTALDASTLLIPLVGFLSPDDPCMRSTVDRIMEKLTDEQGFVYRYNSDDGLHGGEGTFTLCTFWLVDNLAMQGRVNEARSLFERVIAHAGRLRLFSEEIDASNGMGLGNYPQAFTHGALIESVCHLRKAELRQAKYAISPLIETTDAKNANEEIGSRFAHPNDVTAF